ncbi:MAG: BACON domain-containing carbohydrate-binding protein [Acidobacteriota bacterium]
MSKRTRRSASLLIKKPVTRKQQLLLIGLLISLVAAGGVFAKFGWGLQKDGAQNATVSPQSLTSPDREYVYAGGRLVATEEPSTGGGGCTYGINPTSQNFASAGGSGSVTVTTQAGCTWAATSNDGWITITSGSSGSGSGSAGFSVAANSGAQRTGTMTIAGQTFTVTQDAGGSCTYSINPTTQNFVAAGGSSSVTVTTQAGCNWTATSNAAWITITSGSSGTGSGTVNYSVTANSGAQRSGTMTIAGQTFTVTQDAAASCTYSISPTSASYGSSGGSGSVTVTTQAGCTWAATSNDGWITITSGSSGSGSGTVNYSVATNSGAARNGTMTIAGQTFSVSQSAGGGGGGNCTSAGFTPTSRNNIPHAGGTFTATVGATPSGCNWTATSNASWITIVSGGSGTGGTNVTLTYSIPVNNTGGYRTGTITIPTANGTVTHLVKQLP